MTFVKIWFSKIRRTGKKDKNHRSNSARGRAGSWPKPLLDTLSLLSDLFDRLINPPTPHLYRFLLYKPTKWFRRRPTASKNWQLFTWLSLNLCLLFSRNFQPLSSPDLRTCARFTAKGDERPNASDDPFQKSPLINDINYGTSRRADMFRANYFANQLFPVVVPFSSAAWMLSGPLDTSE